MYLIKKIISSISGLKKCLTRQHRWKGQPVSHRDMHGRGCGMAYDVNRSGGAPWSTWADTRTPTPLKMSPKTIQACHSFPTLASSQTLTHTIKRNGKERKDIKPNKIHRYYCWTADSTKAIQLCSTNGWDIEAIRCFYCFPNYCSSLFISLIQIQLEHWGGAN